MSMVGMQSPFKNISIYLNNNLTHADSHVALLGLTQAWRSHWGKKKKKNVAFKLNPCHDTNQTRVCINSSCIVILLLLVNTHQLRQTVYDNKHLCAEQQWLFKLTFCFTIVIVTCEMTTRLDEFSPKALLKLLIFIGQLSFCSVLHKWPFSSLLYIEIISICISGFKSDMNFSRRSILDTWNGAFNNFVSVTSVSLHTHSDFPASSKVVHLLQ